jgi:hypothetical protein
MTSRMAFTVGWRYQLQRPRSENFAGSWRETHVRITLRQHVDAYIVASAHLLAGSAKYTVQVSMPTDKPFGADATPTGSIDSSILQRLNGRVPVPRREDDRALRTQRRLHTAQAWGTSDPVTHSVSQKDVPKLQGLLSDPSSGLR